MRPRGRLAIKPGAQQRCGQQVHPWLRIARIDPDSQGGDAMIVRTLAETTGTERDVGGAGWRSRRLIVRADGMGCSLSDTIVEAGTEQRLHYKHHFETNYCISGEGEVEDLATGQVFPIRPGTVYALDKHDAHVLRATKGELRFVCVFYPALTGMETHQADGSYAAPERNQDQQER
jgi:L-ectoine synthase